MDRAGVARGGGGGGGGGVGGTAEQLARWCAFLEARAAVAVAEAAAAVATVGGAAPATVVRREEVEGVLTMRKTVVSASCWSPG